MSDIDWDAQDAAELAEEEADRQRKAEPRPALSRAEFRAWRSPRIGSENPTRLDNPLWQWLVRTRWSAFSANELFRGPSPFDLGPMWSFDRFGKSETLLPNGEIVHIGGEHQDYYDPDFFIYNDILVCGAEGVIAIYGYPVASFAPTDFHTATLVDGSIFIIGCLGNQGQRVCGLTPIYRLSLDTMSVVPVASGGDSPGWISRHSATLSGDGTAIIVAGGETWRGADLTLSENIDEWSFDLASAQWTRLTTLDWQRWTMCRVDRKPNRLWDVRQEKWHREYPVMESLWQFADAPDLDALGMLYRLDEASPLPDEGAAYNVYRVCIDGVPVRFVEDRDFVSAIVEGRLSDHRLAELQDRTLKTLERIDASVWEIEKA